MSDQASCAVCGGKKFLQNEILWADLIRQWELPPAEVDCINRQQGRKCATCRCPWRSIALADAIMAEYEFQGLFQDFVTAPQFQSLQILEINTAGNLNAWLSKMRGHHLVSYPKVDMQKMPFADGEFDLVVHSDTLEHVPDPLQGLSECSRVLKAGGRCIYTIPMVVSRLSRSRTGLPPSYHGNSSNPEDCLVCTEFGVDAWTWPIRAGFESCKIHKWEFPSAHVFIGRNSSRAGTQTSGS